MLAKTLLLTTNDNVAICSVISNSQLLQISFVTDLQRSPEYSSIDYGCSCSSIAISFSLLATLLSCLPFSYSFSIFDTGTCLILLFEVTSYLY